MVKHNEISPRPAKSSFEIHVIMRALSGSQEALKILLDIFF
jgi:hypothetical protein